VIYCRSWIKALGEPPYNLSLHDRPFLRPRGSYWNTIEEDFHWHIEILPQMFRITGFEWASGFFYNPIPPELAARYFREVSPSEYSHSAPGANSPGVNY
jgi:UDPglucose--hexose-1-phosphate uridylyltransferase